MNGFYLLLRAHDHIWEDKSSWPFQVRIDACQLMWGLALKITYEQGSGNASTADTSAQLVDRLLARNAVV